MIKLLSTILFLILFLLLFPTKSFAAGNKISIDNVWLRVPGEYDQGLIVSVKVAGKNAISGQTMEYKKTFKYNSRCGPLGKADTCLGQISFPEGNDEATNQQFSLDPKETYTVSLEVNHLLPSEVSNNIDQSGKINCVKNCGPWTVRMGDSIPEAVFQWQPPEVEKPTITLSQSELKRGENGIITATIEKLDTRYYYWVTLLAGSRTGFKDFTPAGSPLQSTTLAVYRDGKCGLHIIDQAFSRQTLPYTCYPVFNPQNPYQRTKITVTFNEADFPDKPTTENYQVSVRVYKTFLEEIYKAANQAQIIVHPKGEEKLLLNLKSDPPEIMTKTNQTITLTATGVTKDKKYDFQVGTSFVAGISMKNIVADSDQVSINFKTVNENNLILFNSPGNYLITVSEQGSDKRGQTILKVAPSPQDKEQEVVPTPNLPVVGSAGQFCNVENGQAYQKNDPEIEKLTPQQKGILTAIGCFPTDTNALIQGLVKLAAGIGGGIAFLLMIGGVFQMITSAGNPDTVKAGSEQITSAVAGLLFIIFAVLLLQIIGVDILQIPGFSK